MGKMKHLDEVNETWWHFKFASRIGLIFLITGLFVIIHAIYPNAFKSVGSDVIKYLHNKLENRHDK